MLKVGINPEAVRAKMILENINPDLLFKPNQERKVLLHSPVQPAKKILNWNLNATNKDASSSTNKKSLWKTIFETNQESSFDFDTKHLQQAFEPLPNSHSKRHNPSSLNNKSVISTSNENNQSNNHNKKKRTVKKSLQILPSRRAQNLQIGFARFKLTRKQILSSLQDMRISNQLSLEEDDYQMLLKLLPTNEEIQSFQVRHEKKNSEFEDEIEQFFSLIAMNLPDATTRVESLMFMSKFPISFNDTFNRVERMLMACKLVLENEHFFEELMRTIYIVGTTINKAPEHHGISINGLNEKLLQTKTKDGRLCAIDIVAFLFRKNSVFLTFPMMGSNFQQFSEISIGTVEKELDSLRKGIDVIVSIKSNGELVDSFVQSSKSGIEKLSGDIDRLKLNFYQVLCLFGEPTSRQFNLFFRELGVLLTTIYQVIQTLNLEENDTNEKSQGRKFLLLKEIMLT